MNAAVQAQLNAHKAAPQAPRRSSGTTVTPPAQRVTTGLKSIGRETDKEQPGPRANALLRWQVAGGLHTEQFPGEFRLVVVGPLPLLPALVEALETIVNHTGQ